MKLLVTIAIVLALGTGRADAEIAAWARVRPPPVDNEPPSLVVTIAGEPAAPASAFTITEVVAGAPTTRATWIQRFHGGEDPIAIVLVLEGSEIEMGMTDVEDSGDWKDPGTLHMLATAIDLLQLGHVGIPSSRAAIVTYSTGAEIKLPMGDLARLTGAALGSQNDYRYKIGSDLVAGITLGLDQLAHTHATVRSLIVIGDGNDTNNAMAEGRLKELAHDAHELGIETFAIIRKNPLSDDADIIRTIVPDAKHVNTMDGFAAELNAIATRMTDRYDVAFAGDDLPWDGREHKLAVHLGNAMIDVTVTLPVWNPPHHSRVWPVLVNIGGGVFAAALALLILLLIRRISCAASATRRRRLR